MSKTFVKDPRAVVKSGDIVRVKVLDVDKPRKRISLTLRLDDPVGSQPARAPGADRNAPRGPQRGAGHGANHSASGRGPGGPHGGKATSPGGAMADALRRAGLGTRNGTS